jgi:hypothetical protein
MTSAKTLSTTASWSNRSRFLEKLEWSQTSSSMARPMNQRYGRF